MEPAMPPRDEGEGTSAIFEDMPSRGPVANKPIVKHTRFEFVGT